jgi:hypothetical protein
MNTNKELSTWGTKKLIRRIRWLEKLLDAIITTLDPDGVESGEI